MATKNDKSNDTIVKLVDARLSFPALFEAKRYKGDDKGTPKFSAMFSLDPDDPKQAKCLKTLKAEIARVAKTKWPDAVPPSVLFGKAKCCARDGDDNDNPQFHGLITVSASNTIQPAVCDRDPRIAVTAQDDIIYAGCYVNATIGLWAQDNDYGKRINANLRGVQFVRDGERFGAAPAEAEEEFDNIEDDDDLDEDDDLLD